MIIDAKNIEKSFGSLKVLKGVNFQVEPQEVVSIMGASGAGKSTLLQILGTLSTPDGGSLTIEGTDVLHLPQKLLSAFRNKRIGFVFQAHHLLPEFTALENVMIPALIGGTSRKGHITIVIIAPSNDGSAIGFRTSWCIQNAVESAICHHNGTIISSVSNIAAHMVTSC